MYVRSTLGAVVGSSSLSLFQARAVIQSCRGKNRAPVSSITLGISTILLLCSAIIEDVEGDCDRKVTRIGGKDEDCATNIYCLVVWIRSLMDRRASRAGRQIKRLGSEPKYSLVDYHAAVRSPCPNKMR